MRNETNRAGMARFGINTQNAYGISIRDLRPLAKTIGRNHDLALQLWRTGIHEARILASFIDEADKVGEEQIDAWVADFDSWDLCDQVVDLFIATPFADEKIHAWASAEPEFVKRAAFAMIARRAVRQKKLPDETFLAYLDLIETQAGDPRNYVKKGGQLGAPADRQEISASAPESAGTGAAACGIGGQSAAMDRPRCGARADLRCGHQKTRPGLNIASRMVSQTPWPCPWPPVRSAYRTAAIRSFP